jgi:hypothetical protein
MGATDAERFLAHIYIYCFSTIAETYFNLIHSQ